MSKKKKAEKEDLTKTVEKLCRTLAARVATCVEDEDQFMRHIVKSPEDGSMVEDTYGKADTKAIKEMAQALKAMCDCAESLSPKEAMSAEAPANPAAQITVSFLDTAENLAV